MVHNRAQHAVRTFNDVKFGDFIAAARYDWLMKMLTGSVECVNDALADLCDDLWNSQFALPNASGTKRLENLLVSLVGHEDKCVRSRAVVMLNCLYDHQDWQLSHAFVPVVRYVEDRFMLDVTIDDACNPQKHPEGPQGVFLLMCAPSFVSGCTTLTYSSHVFKWSPVSRGEQHVENRRNYYQFSMANKQRNLFKWKGSIDFGVFPRCGFYDWRVVKVDEDSGSWQAVHSTFAQIRSSSSAALGNRSFSRIPQEMASRLGLGADDSAMPVPFGVFPNPAMWGGHRADGDAMQRSIPLQGRFIVQSQGLMNEQMHEILVDAHRVIFEKDALKERGSFSSVTPSLARLRAHGVSTLLLGGCAARDHGRTVYSEGQGVTYERESASPFAVTCRATPNEMLGGHGSFSTLMTEAQRCGMKILIDAQARVSSSRMHRKYWPCVLHTVDDAGKRVMLYGADGRGMEFEESCLLNYRDAEAWRLLVSDVLQWVKEYNINGVKIGGADSLPPIMQTLDTEMSCRDADGEMRYSVEDQLLGRIVVPFSDSKTGFWDTTSADFYPNPLFIKLCREFWRVRTEFVVVGECQRSREESYESRPGVLIRSGVVPKLQHLPDYLCKIFGKTLNQGRVETLPEPSSIAALRRWFDKSHEGFAEHAVAIQSSCSPLSPYPALLYGRGVWPAVDLLFFLPDIPCTHGDEMNGRAYSLDVGRVFEVHDPADGGAAEVAEEFDPKTKVTKQPSWAAVRSMINLQDSTAATQESSAAPFMRVRGSTSYMTVSRIAELEREFQKNIGPEYGFDLSRILLHYQHRRKLRNQFTLFKQGVLIPLPATSEDDQDVLKHVLCFVRFDSSSGEFALVVINFSDVHHKQCCVSLKSLSQHYFALGLDATSVFEYYDLFELPVDFGRASESTQNSAAKTTPQATSTAARPLTPRASTSLGALNDTKGERGVISLAEMLAEPQMFEIKPFGSLCWGFSLVTSPSRNPENLQALYKHSLTRFEKLLEQVRVYRDKDEQLPKRLTRAITSNFIFASLASAVSDSKYSVDAVADVLHHFHSALEASPDCKLSLYDMLVDSGMFSEKSVEFNATATRRHMAQADVGDYSSHLGVMLFAKLLRIVQGAEVSSPRWTVMPGAAAKAAASTATATPAVGSSGATTAAQSACGAVSLAKTVLDRNSLGPIVFVTSELGKWSTVGGLGVMVDELSHTLAQDFGQEVWVVSPYYDMNRKGETGYLMKDNITYKCNVEITVAGEVMSIGVHEGTVRGVRLFFLHNARFFPQPYPENSAVDALYFLTVLGKGALEVLCHFRQIPQLVVTNDWPTGLVAAFARKGHFGNTFDKTTFFHIVHNLDPSYEGRIYPDRRDDLSWIPGLPKELLVDHTWAQFVFNPSRCALLMSDNWGTVSPSYKEDLLGRGTVKPSPLLPLLQMFTSPFAFPNGIPIKSREARFKTLKVRNHDEAKEYIQMKYFGFTKGDPSVPLFAFIGRITEQKGVHLIIEAAESVIPRYGSKVQFLVGGMVNWRDPYSARVARQLLSLKERYPWSMWAAPTEFFVDGPIVNLGSDFALMPSAFEPGGIVQHEFFLAGTPVIAYCTGGLKDSVFEFQPETGSGNGFTFLSYNVGDLMFAIERATRIFGNSSLYNRLRVSAHESVISANAAANAWLHEFSRLRRKVIIDPHKIVSALQLLPPWSEREWHKRHKAGEDFSFISTSDSAIHSAPGVPSITVRSAEAAGQKSSADASVRIKDMSTNGVGTPPVSSATTASAGSEKSSAGQDSVASSSSPLTPTIALNTSATTPSSATNSNQEFPFFEGSVLSGPPSVSTLVDQRRTADGPTEDSTATPAKDPTSAHPWTTATTSVGTSPHHVSASPPSPATTTIPVVIKWSPQHLPRRPRGVAVSASFDKWVVRRPMTWEPSQQMFTLHLSLNPGKYHYKIIADGVWVVNAADPSEADASGNINNVFTVSHRK